MVSSAVRSLTPWLPPETAGLSGATASTLGNPVLNHTVCRMVPLAMERPGLERVPAVAIALGQLVKQSLALRSPTGGWPADLPQTPENLAPYLSEETGELLEILAAVEPGLECDRTLVPVPTLVPHLLWMLASSGYEIMRLIEGVQAHIHSPEAQGAAYVIRLVPVLVITVDGASYALDLVTQTDPVPTLYLPESSEIRLLENDLDSQPRPWGDLLTKIAQQVSDHQPGLAALLGDGGQVDILQPWQPWQPATLHLHLHLAEMAVQGQAQPALAASAVPEALYLPPPSWSSTPATTPSFTLDDFASTLVDGPGDATTGVLGDWLTFTDERWVQTLLTTSAQRLIAQHLPQLWSGLAGDLTAEQRSHRETVCNRITYRAADLVQGANGLFKHTFVHEPVLVADLWPRLRWYLAQSSERVMQLLGGVSAQVLPPGLSWQQGSLYLRPLMQLTTPQRSWIVDLSRGRLLPTSPQALPGDAAVDVTDAPWRGQLSVAELATLVDHDLTTFTPAIAALRQGTPIHLHRLDAEAGCQLGQLTLNWCFTL